MTDQFCVSTSVCAVIVLYFSVSFYVYSTCIRGAANKINYLVMVAANNGSLCEPSHSRHFPVPTGKGVQRSTRDKTSILEQVLLYW